MSLKTVYSEIGITSRKLTYDDARDYITKAKLGMGDFDYVSYFADADNARLDKDIIDMRKSNGNIAKKVFLAYIREQKKSYALDYDDLLAVTLRILSEREDIRGKWQQRITSFIAVCNFMNARK